MFPWEHDPASIPCCGSGDSEGLAPLGQSQESTPVDCSVAGGVGCDGKGERRVIPGIDNHRAHFSVSAGDEDLSWFCPECVCRPDGHRVVVNRCRPRIGTRNRPNTRRAGQQGRWLL